MTGVASDEARATHEPSPDGLGHSVGVANAVRLQDLIEQVEARLVRAVRGALSPATWDREGPHRTAASEYAVIALALRGAKAARDD